ncbi:Rz1-like lysis system protein LysC [Actinobacillus pleuropneumoniae]|uniref:Rz1-like lysis system protein LysC n=1 Tax=Actinobacillus pleuropneumoniae TaxID=715 RepID=UPI003B220F7C
MYPPSAYLTQCGRTGFSGSTYADMADYLIVVMQERDLCASKIDNIREWRRQKVSNDKP